jgi:hypothetical protein
MLVRCLVQPEGRPDREWLCLSVDCMARAVIGCRWLAVPGDYTRRVMMMANCQSLSVVEQCCDFGAPTPIKRLIFMSR